MQRNDLKRQQYTLATDKYLCRHDAMQGLHKALAQLVADLRAGIAAPSPPLLELMPDNADQVAPNQLASYLASSLPLDQWLSVTKPDGIEEDRRQLARREGQHRSSCQVGADLSVLSLSEAGYCAVYLTEAVRVCIRTRNGMRSLLLRSAGLGQSEIVLASRASSDIAIVSDRLAEGLASCPSIIGDPSLHPALRGVRSVPDLLALLPLRQWLSWINPAQHIYENPSVDLVRKHYLSKTMPPLGTDQRSTVEIWPGFRVLCERRRQVHVLRTYLYLGSRRVRHRVLATGETPDLARAVRTLQTEFDFFRTLHHHIPAGYLSYLPVDQWLGVMTGQSPSKRSGQLDRAKPYRSPRM